MILLEFSVNQSLKETMKAELVETKIKRKGEV